MKKAALIEFNSYHDECLYSQIKFLDSAGYSLTLVVSSQIKDRASEYLDIPEDVITFDRSHQKNFFSRISFLWKLKKQFKRRSLKKIIFNTASSRLEVILLSFILKRQTALFGILHNLKKVNHSFSQKLINRSIKNYFVLNDFLEDSIPLEDKSIRLQSFYPIFFPNYEETILKKPKGEIWISIPGKLDFGRRDYYLVAEALQKTLSKSNLKILILGSTNSNDPRNGKFIEFLQKNDLQEHFMTFDSFLDNDVFHDYLKKSDYILIPLNIIGNNYAKHKIMGCYNQAFGYRKTLISPIGLSHIPDIDNHSILYDGAKGLSMVLEQISQGKAEKKEYPESKWSFEAQKSNYINFLEENQIK
ncbi:hypothetical protein [Flagellimonas okinawensis]|uniref:Glycosyl transferase family 1 domain-containing protein n=1 Tax=Flagellimonas okinawensis TaxID=3031324 RepID=A0ABT5XKS6_9FLAO|nr:hypothetical protein [[Muricauda] okinawensis]MDF0706415.1 hypothetical protein [[Muricauda] okinawensis]